MGWQWHQLDHMQIICTSLQTDNHASTSPLSFYRPDALPAIQPTASKHWRHSKVKRSYERVLVEGCSHYVWIRAYPCLTVWICVYPVYWNSLKSTTTFILHACLHIRNTPHAEIKLIENNDNIHTDASSYHSAPHSVWIGLKASLQQQQHAQHNSLSVQSLVMSVSAT